MLDCRGHSRLEIQRLCAGAGGRSVLATHLIGGKTHHEIPTWKMSCNKSSVFESQQCEAS